MSPKQIADLISRTRRSAYQENKGQALFRGQFSDAQDREAWATLLLNGSPYLDDVVVGDIASDAQYEAEDLPEIGVTIRFVVTKPTDDHIAYLFSGSALPIVEQEIDDVRLFRIASLSETEEFATYRAFFRKWDEVENQVLRTNPELTDPRQFSKDFSGDNCVREDIRPWLLNDPPDERGEFFDQWALIAGKYILSALASSVDLGADGPVYYLDGPPSVSFSITDELLQKVEGRAQLAARWIYAQEERDADVRHLLYSTELARSFRASGLGELGLSALESAQSAYRAYIKSKSAETLQALSKLRHSVLEETQKISERGHEFTKNLWRDGVVAATPFLLRLVSAPSAESAAAASKVIALGIAIFLLVSIASQWYLNERWLASQRQSRGIWRFDLNTALTSEEIKKVIEDPVSRTVFDYRAMGSIVSAVYAAAIASLIAYSIGWLSLPT